METWIHGDTANNFNLYSAASWRKRENIFLAVYVIYRPSSLLRTIAATGVESGVSSSTVDSRLTGIGLSGTTPPPKKKEEQIAGVGMCGKTAFLSTLPIVLDSSSRPRLQPGSS
ncbi:hypothetical protein AVEN_49109-1 [Araneus ventricosus]|uniref:Uncharacterized protein n=1 Tax=Araneus ventricosus TaxID=182803 RepID=A0A4Y2BZF1_ARAVE|nr:hypothetical protein AVEN_49109-1 [Araneus ventricosus]